MSSNPSERPSRSSGVKLPDYAEWSQDDRKFDSDDDFLAEREEQEIFPDPEDCQKYQNA
jgi:hypothetical protein